MAVVQYVTEAWKRDVLTVIGMFVNSCDLMSSHTAEMDKEEKLAEEIL